MFLYSLSFAHVRFVWFFYNPISFCFFFSDMAPTDLYTLSLHDALPICSKLKIAGLMNKHDSVGIDLVAMSVNDCLCRSEEHTSELQSHSDLVCRLLLEKKKTTE